MNTGKFKVFRKLLFVACSLLTLATLPANADLLIGISFPSQGGGDNDVVGFDSTDPGTVIYEHPIVPAGANDTIQIDESLLTLPKLHLQDSHWFGADNKISSGPWYTTFVITNYSEAYLPYFHTNATVFPSSSYSHVPAKIDQSVSPGGTPNSSAAPDSSISGSASATPSQPATGILNLTLDQNTLKLDWPADRVGWLLQTQTNPGINSRWFPILGSSLTNHLDLTLDRANPSVFFRLIAP